jgi:hypothetical protein
MFLRMRRTTRESSNILRSASPRAKEKARPDIAALRKSRTTSFARALRAASIWIV